MDKERKNAYTCQKCGTRFITIDKDEGVTPFMIPCLTKITYLTSLVDYPKNRRRNCNGEMYSSFYRTRPEDKPTFEWFLPDPNRNFFGVIFYDDAMKEHIKQGGLDLRIIKE